MSDVDEFVGRVLEFVTRLEPHYGAPAHAYFCQFPESPRLEAETALEPRCASCLVGIEASCRLAKNDRPLRFRRGSSALYGDDRLEALARLRHLAQTSGVEPLPAIEPDQSDWLEL